MKQEKMEMYRSDITKDEINQLEVNSYEGRITLVEDPKYVKNCINEIRKFNIIGFDTESRPSFKKSQHFQVSLIQLATPEEVYLFRLNKIGFHPELISLFEDPEITKVGVSIHDDIGRLKAIHSFEPSNFIELQELSTEYGIESNSLRKLVAIILGFRISKSQQLSNWEADQLTEGQMVYAATDAWASLEIYTELINHGI
jgi:ribonuclease D